MDWQQMENRLSWHIRAVVPRHLSLTAKELMITLFFPFLNSLGLGSGKRAVPSVQASALITGTWIVLVTAAAGVLAWLFRNHKHSRQETGLRSEDQAAGDGGSPFVSPSI